MRTAVSTSRSDGLCCASFFDPLIGEARTRAHSRAAWWPSSTSSECSGAPVCTRFSMSSTRSIGTPRLSCASSRPLSYAKLDQSADDPAGFLQQHAVVVERRIHELRCLRGCCPGSAWCARAAAPAARLSAISVLRERSSLSAPRPDDPHAARPATDVARRELRADFTGVVPTSFGSYCTTARLCSGWM